MLRFPRWNSQESFSTPPRISYVRVLKGSRAFYPIPRAASLLPRIFSLSLFIFLFLSLSSSLCIALLANPLDEEYARLPPSYSFLLERKGYHRKDTRPRMRPFPSIKEKSYFRILSTRLEEHSLLRVFVTSCLQDSYFFAFSSWKEYRDEIILFAKINSLVFQ